MDSKMLIHLDVSILLSFVFDFIIHAITQVMKPYVPLKKKQQADAMPFPWGPTYQNRTIATFG